MSAKCLILFLGCLGFLTQPSFGENIAKKVYQIDRTCHEIDIQLKQQASNLFWVGNPGPGTDSPWKLFETQQELERAKCSESAKVYLKGTLPGRVDMEFKGPARDWVNYVHFYYDKDGSLQKMHSELKRFGAYERGKEESGEGFMIRVVRTRYFDSDGKCFFKTKPRYFNAATQRQIFNPDFKDASWPTYARFEKLPFYNLITADSIGEATPIPTKSRK